MTYHQRSGRGYGHVTVLKFAVCRDAARRAGLSSTAELLVSTSRATRRLSFSFTGMLRVRKFLLQLRAYYCTKICQLLHART